MHSIKNLFCFFVFLSFLITSCSEDDKEHTVEKGSLWTQTTEDSTYIFQLYWKASWRGTRKEHLLEHYGECSYCSFPKGENPMNYLWTIYNYDRDGDNIKIYRDKGINPLTIETWLQGHIANDTMFLSNDTQTFKLQKIKSYSDIP